MLRARLGSFISGKCDSTMDILPYVMGQMRLGLNRGCVVRLIMLLF